MVITNIDFTDSIAKNCSVVVGIYENGELSENAKKMDEELGGEISRNIKKIDFSGKLFDNFSFISANNFWKYVFVICLGEKGKKYTKFEFEKLGASIYSMAKNYDEKLTIAIDSDDVICPCESCKDKLPA